MRHQAYIAPLFLLALSTGCGAEETTKTTPSTVRKVAAPVKKSAGFGPGQVTEFKEGKKATLIMSQSHSMKRNGKMIPGPAKMVLWQETDSGWSYHVVEDAMSNVFHKAMPWGDGQILTVSGDKAAVRSWSLGDGKWTAKTLNESDWGGKFNRYRDVEVGDVDADGTAELVLATHDSGVVSVGDIGQNGWQFAEYDKKADTFVHEIEIGDVDGDGKMEFYATPSDRNRSSGESQPGLVVRYDKRGAGYVQSTVVEWENSHAKEILVANLDGQGDALYAVIEAHTVKDPETKQVKIVEPVKIVRLSPSDGGWKQTTVATLQDRQCRFIVPGDVDGDGEIEIVAAGMKSGLWVLQPRGDGTFEPELLDAKSGGFEHATHVADLDGNGTPEIYVAADSQHELRRYVFKDGKFNKELIAPIPKMHITWNLQDGVF